MRIRPWPWTVRPQKVGAPGELGVSGASRGKAVQDHRGRASHGRDRQHRVLSRVLHWTPYQGGLPLPEKTPNSPLPIRGILLQQGLEAGMRAEGIPAKEEPSLERLPV